MALINTRYPNDRLSGATHLVMPAQAGIHDCVPGMALILEVQVLYGPIGRNR